ncbi:helix-turn-helix transcriptional regulator [Oricola sp.]|uniref:helix-turn-helix domain-containing protein n=1 Tax=Oricola sp. TaxID=1979950 RepID=UPI0025DF7274|nr:helix-turn-helix transcriptional regulator [Oricola sp.]MCI5077640.1 helix-turn-helix domain-containing protein [Oricola sp.]
MRKEDRADLFRRRVSERMAATGISRSGLARSCHVDRSTVAQILNGDDPRLPNAHLAAEFATALGVSADWLLGLTERSETAADLLSTSFRIADAHRAPADDQIIAWHREAAGHKIRHVSATLPDILKTEEVLGWEYAAFLSKTPEQAMQSLRDTVEWLRAPGSDYEICVSRDMVESLARGEGYWKGLPRDVARRQIEGMAESCARLYPSLRVYLYDSKRVFSAPITVFGPLLAVVYVGQFYMVFRENRQVRALTQHFDQLVRESDIDARSVPDEILSYLG